MCRTVWIYYKSFTGADLGIEENGDERIKGLEKIYFWLDLRYLANELKIKFLETL